MILYRESLMMMPATGLTFMAENTSHLHMPIYRVALPTSLQVSLSPKLFQTHPRSNRLNQDNPWLRNRRLKLLSKMTSLKIGNTLIEEMRQLISEKTFHRAIRKQDSCNHKVLLKESKRIMYRRICWQKIGKMEMEGSRKASPNSRARKLSSSSKLHFFVVDFEKSWCIG